MHILNYSYLSLHCSFEERLIPKRNSALWIWRTMVIICVARRIWHRVLCMHDEILNWARIFSKAFVFSLFTSFRLLLWPCCARRAKESILISLKTLFAFDQIHSILTSLSTLLFLKLAGYGNKHLDWSKSFIVSHFLVAHYGNYHLRFLVHGVKWQLLIMVLCQIFPARHSMRFDSGQTCTRFDESSDSSLFWTMRT